jgi:hypothetical protein
MATNAAELLELLLVELGINTLRTTRIERLQLWRQFQGEMRATDSRLFIVVERTEDLAHEVLHALDQLTAPDAAGNSGANLVMLGHPGIEQHLAPSLLESLRQRIRLHADLEPFTEAELQDYLRHQVACAGGHFDRIFAPGTVAALHRYTRGVARLANTLCESALDVAAAQNQMQLTAELISKTAVAQLKLVEPVTAARIPSAAASRAPAPVVAMPVAAATAAKAAPTIATAATGVVPAPGLAVFPATPLAVPTPAVATPAVATPVATAFTVATAAGITPAVATPAATGPAVPAPVAAVPAAATLAATATPQPVLLAAVATALPPAPVAAERHLHPTAQAAPLPAESQPPEVEYDGSATDVADVAAADFPVLTDAVEFPLATSLFKRTAPIPAVPPAATAPPAAAAIAAKPASKPAGRIETAYAPPKAVTPPPTAWSPPAERAAAPKPAPVTPQSVSADPEADDALRQTQSMRAIAIAKSIDDLSELDAETLFGDAGLDLVSAALASAAEWPDDELEPVAPPAAPLPRAQHEAKKAPPPADDPFDFFGLGEDAPLELIDDSAPLASDHARKTATR